MSIEQPVIRGAHVDYNNTNNHKCEQKIAARALQLHIHVAIQWPELNNFENCFAGNCEYIIFHTVIGYTHNFTSFSAVSRGGPWAKGGQAIARMPDRLLQPWSLLLLN